MKTHIHNYFLHAAYGWLALSSVLHFGADVVSQYLRVKREPSLETTLYYGLNTALSLGQLMFGLLGLYVAWKAMHLLATTPALVLALAAGLGWLAVSFFFIEYWEPKLNIAIFCVLIVAACATRSATHV